MNWLRVMDAMREQINKWLDEGSSPETIKEIMRLTVEQMIEQKEKSSNSSAGGD